MLLVEMQVADDLSWSGWDVVLCVPRGAQCFNGCLMPTPMRTMEEMVSPGGRDRPRVTFMVLAYQQEAYVRQACEAALAQEYDDLEVSFSDDCSSDGTYEIMCDVADSYSGPHKVIVNRNPTNLGLIGHVNRELEIVSGDVIIASGGDDISLPHRTRTIMSRFSGSVDDPVLVHSSVQSMDAEGNDLSVWPVPPLARGPMTLRDIALARALYIGATGAWSRRLWDHFGPLSYSRAYEDLCIGFRAALLDGIAYIDEPLVRYRIGVGMSTQRRRPTGIRSRLQRNRGALVREMHVVAQRVVDVNTSLGINPHAGLSEVRRLLERDFLTLRGRAAVYGAWGPAARTTLPILECVLMGFYGAFHEILSLARWFVRRNGSQDSGQRV